MLFHLGYVSTQTSPMRGPDLLALLEEARSANQELDITGLLLHREDSFFQVLEGSEENVWQVFRKVRLDKRHHAIKILFQGPVAKREFYDWRMGFLQLDGIDVSKIPGFSDFLTDRTEPRELFEKLTRARRLLLLFRAMT